MHWTSWWYAARPEWAWKNALEHVSAEMRPSNIAMSQALSKLLDDIRVLPTGRTLSATSPNALV